MTAPEAYIRYSTEVFTADGEVVDDAMATFLSNFMAEFRTHVARECLPSFPGRRR